MDIPIDYKAEIEYYIDTLTDDEYMLLFNVMYNMYFSIGKMPREVLGLSCSLKKWELGIISEFHLIKQEQNKIEQIKKQENKE